ncbi:DUF302 domain-containing protein [Dyella humicola]|uniref:DUF302 domain-containing protein n=1 Tax=Dyella humicola TaxID=2992126 RepID=UPI00224E38D4|nr:DUF302 domain-containing protein [Dyella humicola]
MNSGEAESLGSVLRSILLATTLGYLTMTNAQADQGIVQIRSQHGVSETLQRLEQILAEHQLTIFARIDFSGDAARAGLAMRPEQMLIFGNPKAGTPLLQASPTVGLDLPLKALAWEDEQGATWIAYNEADYVITRHQLPPSMEKNIGAAAALLQLAAQ